MKITFLTIGKANESFIQPGVDEFTRRIKHYYPVEWKVIATPKGAGSPSEKELKRREAALVLGKLTKDDFLIALDQKGEMIDSLKLADFIQGKANDSIKQLVFLIGGAFGIDETVIYRADFVWSLSELTFPHQLVRLILAEQVYRACTISKNEKYHHA